jgi:hypothetical protein
MQCYDCLAENVRVLHSGVKCCRRVTPVLSTRSQHLEQTLPHLYSVAFMLVHRQTEQSIAR